MNRKDHKKILHVLIESIKSKSMLYNLEKDAFPYVIKNRTKKKDRQELILTEEQKQELEEAIHQVETGDTLTSEEFEDQMENRYPGFKKRMKKRREEEKKRIDKSSKKKLKKKLHSRIDGINSKYVLNILLTDIMPNCLD
ncbi:MAG: hypothetical protein ACTHK0_10575 [Ginsengibacter sp.]